MPPCYTRINPAFNRVSTLLNCLFVSIAMGNASRKFGYSNDVSVVFLTPLNNHGVVIILIAHSCTSFNFPIPPNLTCDNSPRLKLGASQFDRTPTETVPEGHALAFDKMFLAAFTSRSAT